MTRAQFSVYIWSAYLFSASAFILVAPASVFLLLGLNDPGGGMWPRLSGMLLGILGYFFFEAARANNLEFMRWGSLARMIPILFLSLFVAYDLESPLVLTCGIVDVLAGLWTLWALRTDAAAALVNLNRTKEESSVLQKTRVSAS